jgi:RNA-directed DNA polymerase
MSKKAIELAQILGIPLQQLRSVAGMPNELNYRYERRLIGKKERTLRVPIGLHREILDSIKAKVLDVMPLPPAMHGWRKRRSPKTYAKCHLRRSGLVNVDIQDFFPSVDGGRVFSFWMRAGYDSEAAKLLARLTTCDNQLPQGSPTSQSIGNHVLVHLSQRLRRLASLHDLKFSMYGDEFTLSGRKRVKRLRGLLIRIVEQEGLKANPAKVKVIPRAERQEIAGIVVNKKTSLGRKEYRELRAILYNSCKLGPESQNRNQHPSFRQHLRGRIAHLQQVNPKLGAHLLSVFDQIRWI